MKLSNWAKQQGVSYITAYRWFKAGKIPNARQRDNGTILIDENYGNDKIVVVIGSKNNIKELVDKIKDVIKI